MTAGSTVRRMTTSGSAKAPPRGSLFQERLVGHPFWMLLACQLVNLTSWEVAQPVFSRLLARYLTPDNLAAAKPEDLHDLLRPLWLWRRRSITLPKFASAWLQDRPTCYDDVLKLPGCGKYAADNWAIFVEGDLTVQPNDGKLNWYLQRKAK